MRASSSKSVRSEGAKSREPLLELLDACNATSEGQGVKKERAGDGEMEGCPEGGRQAGSTHWPGVARAAAEEAQRGSSEQAHKQREWKGGGKQGGWAGEGGWKGSGRGGKTRKRRKEKKGEGRG